jgi:hypothetical protein
VAMDGRQGHTWPSPPGKLRRGLPPWPPPLLPLGRWRGRPCPCRWRDRPQAAAESTTPATAGLPAARSGPNHNKYAYGADMVARRGACIGSGERAARIVKGEGMFRERVPQTPTCGFLGSPRQGAGRERSPKLRSGPGKRTNLRPPMFSRHSVDPNPIPPSRLHAGSPRHHRSRSYPMGQEVLPPS